MNDKSRTLDDVKTFMCPLGNKCPDHIGARWPVSDIKNY